MTVLDDQLASALGPKLEPLGLELVRPRLWVSNSTPPLRRMFGFYPLKGMRYTARWGFSLDFVPHLSGRRLRWKRTSKTACLDLSIDPIDALGSVQDWCSILFYPPIEMPSPDEIAKVTFATSEQARADFTRVASVHDVVALFEERSKIEFGRFSLKHYVQTDIAWGLALMAVGLSEEGETHVAAYCDRFRVDRNDPILSKARLAAAEHFAAESSGTVPR